MAGGVRSPEPWFWRLAIVAPALFVLTYVLFVRTTIGQQFDDIAFDGRAVEDPELTRIANELLHTVTRSTLLLLTLALVVFALARRRLRLAVAVGAAVAASVVSTELLKHFLDRPQLDEVGGIAFNSFPSGHATIGMAQSLGIVMVAPYRWRWVAMVAAVVVAIGFGIGVLATGWHRPSDTFGAYLVCTTWFSIATGLLLHLRGPGVVGDDVGKIEERLTNPAAIAAGLLIAVAAVVVLVLSFQEEGLRTVEFAAEYLAVCLAVIILAVGIVVGYHQLLRGVSLDQPAASGDTGQPTASVEEAGAR
jgi:membrane-associated phospholipid phosphatase